MTRPIRTFLPVAGEPAALLATFAGDPGRWLPQARHQGDGRWLLTVRGAGVSWPVDLLVGEPWRAGSTSWRSWSWQPLDDRDDAPPVGRLLPPFDGELGLHVGTGGATLILDGRYHPPGGGLGTALDTLGLQGIARGTTDRLLTDLAASLNSAALLAV